MWRRWLVVIIATAAILAAAVWAELQYQPGISGGHQQQQHPPYAIGNSSQKLIFPAELFIWIDDVVGWTDTHHDFVLAVANVFLAAFTLALFAATFGLLRFAKRQASDMESLLTAAHDTAAASASQVRAIEAQERVMREQAKTMAANLDLTKRAADAAQASADAANTHATAAEEANRINRDLLIATQRPWISVDLAPASDLMYRDDGVYLQITCTMTNVGSTPAIYVWPHLCGILQGSQNATARQRALITEARQATSIGRDLGHAIFPGAQHVSVLTAILIKNEEIAGFQPAGAERTILQIARCRLRQL